VFQGGQANQRAGMLDCQQVQSFTTSFAENLEQQGFQRFAPCHLPGTPIEPFRLLKVLIGAFLLS
jgi:hypothetical protein